MRWARFVDPRTSAKSKDRSTSAPPGCVLQIRSQKSQKRGFLLYWPRPTSRISKPPTPVKGALQFLQRCPPGIILRSRHPLRQMGFSPAMTARHIASTAGSVDIPGLLIFLPQPKRQQHTSSRRQWPNYNEAGLSSSMRPVLAVGLSRPTSLTAVERIRHPEAHLATDEPERHPALG